MDAIFEILWATWATVAVSAPWLLTGLLAAGLLHVYLPDRRVERSLGRGDVGGVLRAALFGVPLPVCSCGVVPLAIALRRKGASAPASVSFLITTPESGADSIALTWGLMGPAMALARPVASLATALLAGAWVARADRPAGTPAPSPAPAASTGASTGDAGSPGTCGCDATAAGASPPPPPPEGMATRLLGALRYGFVVLLGDIAPWLVGGFLLTGLISALLPSDLAAFGFGGGLVAMLAALAVSVPIYLCASASTLVAAALVAKGLSPGAALVLLLAGPATNAASLTVLTAEFGRRTIRIYLAAIVLGSLAAGLLFDALLAWSGWRVLGGVEHAVDALGSSVWTTTAGLALTGLVAVGLVRRWIVRPAVRAGVLAGR